MNLPTKTSIDKKDFGMRLNKFTVLVLILFFLGSPVCLPDEDRRIRLHPKRLAVVIGNGAYQTVPLKTPANDAEDMSATL